MFWLFEERTHRHRLRPCRGQARAQASESPGHAPFLNLQSKYHSFQSGPDSRFPARPGPWLLWAGNACADGDFSLDAFVPVDMGQGPRETKQKQNKKCTFMVI